MPKMAVCEQCRCALTADDIGATRKLINRASETFYCVPCLSKRFSVEESVLREKIEEWRAYGCMLFSPKKES